jgi:hypothetical protein
VVILIIDENGVFSIEAKRKPPISIYAYCPMGREVGGQSMKLPSGNIHVFGPLGGIQNGKLLVQLLGMTGLNPGFRTGQEKLLDSFMPEAADHSGTIVPRNVTLHTSWTLIL